MASDPRRSLRKSLKRREFELDGGVATQLGTEHVILVLGKMLVALRIIYRRLCGLKIPPSLGKSASYPVSMQTKMP